ncbi:MAG: alpha/beta fold hydrolase [Dehalococcoidia bacterium]|nr:MAG: alpha/beta fold hydrolase [Dehalococcoidia bacterium]
MPFITANGISQHYELTGDGKQAVVWIHGIGSRLETWATTTPQFPGFRHLTYDVRGMGESGHEDGPVSLTTWARDLDALMEALGIPRAVVVGHSMGGAIAQRFTVDFPHRVDGLLLFATSSRVGGALAAGWLKRATEFEAEGNLPMAETNRAVAAYRMDEGLKRITAPTLILVGGDDPQTPPGGSVIISRCIPNAELEIFPGIGHSIYKDEPKSVDRAKRWLTRFL